jgi:hypothetical protein|tara:strand:+ start:923 stop:1192 length:270 start_codon:yes stop_codon:yes gene_type:complete
MAITKELVIDKIEVLELGQVQVRTVTRIKEDDVQISQSYSRHIVVPCIKQDDSWADTDISGEDAEVQAVANAKWTSEVKTAYKAFEDAR